MNIHSPAAVAAQPAPPANPFAAQVQPLPAYLHARLRMALYDVKPHFAALRSAGIPAAILGGYLRDTLYRLSYGFPQKPKDIDFFVPAFAGVQSKLCFAGPPFGTPAKQNPQERANSSERMFTPYNGVQQLYHHFVWDYAPHTKDSPPVQVIGWDEAHFSLEELTATADIGLCQIATDGERVLCTPAFLQDHAARRIAIRRAVDKAAMEASLKRAQALAKKLQTPNRQVWVTSELHPLLPADWSHRVAILV